MALEPKKVGNSEFEVSYTIEGEELQVAKEKAFQELSKNITVKGFRKGKAPRHLVEARISKYELNNKTIEVAINPALRKVIEETHLRPAMQSDVRLTNFTDDKIEVVYTIVVEPTVKLGKYKDVKVAKTVSKVTKEDVENEIQKLLEENSELVVTEEGAKLGDTVVFDFKGYIDNKEFEGGSAQNYSLVLGSNQFIPGFEDQLVNCKAGDKVDVNVTFPEQYIKDLAGKAAKFVCLVHEVKSPVKPELNDEFVKSLDLENVENVEQLKEHKKKELEDTKERDARNQQLNDLINKIVNDSEVEISEKLLNQDVEAIKQENIRRIESNGLTLKQYQEVTGISDEEFEKQAHDVALGNIKQALVYNQIALDNNLLVTRSDLDNYYESIANRYAMKLDDVKKVFQANEQSVVRNLLDTKVQQFLISENLVDKKKEKEVKAEEKEETKEEKKAPKKSTKAKKEENKDDSKAE